jgi:hypothetical protein
MKTKEQLFKQLLLEFYLTKHSSLKDVSTAGLFSVRRPGRKQPLIIPERTPQEIVHILRTHPHLLNYELVWIDSATGEEIPLPKEIKTPRDLVKLY